MTKLNHFQSSEIISIRQQLTREEIEGIYEKEYFGVDISLFPRFLFKKNICFVSSQILARDGVLSSEGSLRSNDGDEFFISVLSARDLYLKKIKESLNADLQEAMKMDSLELELETAKKREITRPEGIMHSLVHGTLSYFISNWEKTNLEEKKNLINRFQEGIKNIRVNGASDERLYKQKLELLMPKNNPPKRVEELARAEIIYLNLEKEGVGLRFTGDESFPSKRERLYSSFYHNKSRQGVRAWDLAFFHNDYHLLKERKDNFTPSPS